MKAKYVQLATKIAQKSDSPFRLGCVVVRKNKVLSVGWNNMAKSHPKCKTHGNYIHSELHALIGLDSSITKGATAYICRLKKNGSYGISKPCSVCLNALKLANIKNIYYSTDNGFKMEKL